MRILSAALLCASLCIQQAWSRPATQKRDADFLSVRTRLDRSFVDPEREHPQKYFHESTFHQHYDGRFADKPLKYDDKQLYLSWLVRSYLDVMQDIGAETWLMHGTLLGWYWNRKIMPWDSDIDVMISEPSLHHLANWYNMTMHRWMVPGYWHRKYMLEVNPNYREGGLDRMNRIDARWIDVDVGLFIDITTLRPNTTARALGNKEAMMVKDKHHYMLDDIFPLRRSEFEGTPVSIPYAYPEILVEEYGNESLSGTNHEHHRYDPSKQKWVPVAVLSPKDGME